MGANGRTKGSRGSRSKPPQNGTVASLAPSAMSHLREIMQRLSAAQAAPQPEGSATTSAQAGDANAEAAQLSDFQRQLSRCSAPMLRYEWTWLEQHLEDLQLCLEHDAMREAAGGRQHLQALIEHHQQCRSLLQEQLQARGLEARRESHSVVSGEHAWEVHHPAIRAQWGLD